MGWGGWYQIIKIEENFISKSGFKNCFRFYRPKFHQDQFTSSRVTVFFLEKSHIFGKYFQFFFLVFFGSYGDMSHILCNLRNQNHKDLSGAHFFFRFGSSRMWWGEAIPFGVGGTIGWAQSGRGNQYFFVFRGVPLIVRIF